MPKVSYYQKKADRLLQEWGRENYPYCLVCGKQSSCLHHYYPKSTSSALRYEDDNLIPLCKGCHFSHHNGNPAIHNTINQIMGKPWLNRLKRKKEQIIKTNIGYYKNIIENISN
jgi:5-methylcytosine-specific restriction endonuclease McrA